MSEEHNIKVVFFDVDGTLFSPARKEVPVSARRAIKALRGNGIYAVIATGRHIIEFSKLPVDEIQFDGYLTLNGNLALDEHKKVYAGTPIKREEMEVLSKIFSAKRIPFALIGQDEKYINYINETVIKTQTETSESIPDVGTWKGEDVYQIQAFVPEHEKKLLDSILDECSITSWNDTGIDIIPKGGGKPSGIKLFMDEHGIRQEEAMAFGDGENDKEMLKFAGIGVAMGNADDSVKAVADYVTDSVDDNGIENALKHFGLI